MDYAFLCVAILLWLVRPQDWISAIAGMGLMSYAMLAALAGVYSRRAGVALRQFFYSPADYFMGLYLLWIIFVTGDVVATGKALIPYAAFYYVTAIALNTTDKLRVFLNCWAAGFIVVGLLAASSVYGIEWVQGSQDLTEGFDGRLCLNTWIFNNPNALGHGMASSLAFAYIWLVWRRGFFCRLIGVLGLVVLGDILYLTQSKGGYLAAAGSSFLMFLRGKRRAVQVFAIATMATGGIAALRMLPRMDNLSESEEGIQGRLAIWQMAYQSMVDTFYGEGWNRFEAWIMTADLGLIRKATHGSYVNVGADLGYGGLLLYVAIIYAGLRTLLQCRVSAEDLTLRRIQGALLALLIAYALSAWIVDRAYHMDFFMLSGAVAAFHRIMTRDARALGASESTTPLLQTTARQRRRGPLEVEAQEAPSYALLPELPMEQWPTDLRSQWPLGLKWRRLTWRDWAAAGLCCYLVIEVWTSFMTGFTFP